MLVTPCFVICSSGNSKTRRDIQINFKGSIKKVHVPIIEKINETHEFVQELVNNCSYSLEMSIVAVEATRAKSLAAAIEYINAHCDNEDPSKQFIEQHLFRSYSDEFDDYDTER